MSADFPLPFYPMQFRLVGVAATDSGPHRRSWAHLGNGTGLHVLYGKNGAGKSSLLRCLTDGDGALVVAGDGPPDEYFDQYLDDRSSFPFLRAVVEERCAGYDVDSESVLEEFAHTPYFLCRGGMLQPALIVDASTPRALESYLAAAEERSAHEMPSGQFWWGPYSSLFGYTHVSDTHSFSDVADLEPPLVVALRPDQGPCDLASVSGFPQTYLVTDSTEAVAIADTIRCLTESAGVEDFSSLISPDFEEARRELANRTNALYQGLFLNAPQLALVLNPPLDWAARGVLSWRVASRANNERVWYHSATDSLASLSEAQQRWAILAIRIAVKASTSAVFLVIDEPERGLHRTAEAHLARGLASLASDDNLVVVATHSPYLLDAEQAQLHEVVFAEEGSFVRDMPAPSRDRLLGLGLNPSDLLHGQKTILLVEGRHEEIVLPALLKGELERRGIYVLPLAGGRHAEGAAASRVFADFSDAPIVLLLDNLDGERVARDYRQALSMAVTTSPAEAATWFRSQYSGKSKVENLFLRDFVSSLLERHGNPTRFSVWGLHAQDIIEYLDVNAFVERAATWQELREKHRASESRKDFKTWLTSTYEADFGDENLRRAAVAISIPPADLMGLLEECLRVRD